MSLHQLVFNTSTLPVELRNYNRHRSILECVMDEAIALHFRGFVVFTGIPELLRVSSLRVRHHQHEIISFTRPMQSVKVKMVERALALGFYDDSSAEASTWKQSPGYALADDQFVSSPALQLETFLIDHLLCEDQQSKTLNFQSYLQRLRETMEYLPPDV
jgi:hypothetical protein